MPEARLEFLLYRCKDCGRLLTCHEIVRTWEAWEKAGTESKGLCPCGSGKIRPSNPTPDEYKRFASTKQLIRYLRGHLDDESRLWEVAFKSPKATFSRWDRFVIWVMQPWRKV